MTEMPIGKSSIYSDHYEQRDSAMPPSERPNQLAEALLTVFESHVQYRTIPIVLFDEVSVDELANAFISKPIIVKSILASVNVAQRAIKRDLGVDIDTYSEKISLKKAYILAGYIKPMLPKELAVPALLMLDEFFYVDKEMRAGKGRWETKIRALLNEYGSGLFRKRKLKHDVSEFELDAACPAEAHEPVDVGVDVKRYESPRDFHKRGDEITQKVSHLKEVNPGAKFYAVIYYPFPARHDEVRRRYAGQHIDGIYFAGETEESLKPVAIAILKDCGLLKPDVISASEEE